MAVVLTEGFDMYNGVGTNTGLQALWANVGSGGQVATMVAGRFGGQCMRTTDGAGVIAAYRRNLPASTTTFCTGFAFKQDFLTNIGTQPIVFMLDSAFAAQIGVYITGTGVLEVTRGANAAVLISSAAGAIIVSTWHYIEVFGTINGTTGTMELWLDGVQIGTFSGNTLQTANVNVAAIYCQNPDGTGTGNFAYFDDIYVTNTATRLGERRVETLRPASDISKVWTPDTGTANFSRVNETLVDGDTSYVQGTSVGDRDLYSIGALSSTPTAIDAVNVVSFAEKTDALTRQIYNSVQSAGTDSDGSALTLAASYGRFDRLILTDPNGGGAWTASRVNGLQIGPKVAA